MKQMLRDWAKGTEGEKKNKNLRIYLYQNLVWPWRKRSTEEDRWC